MASHTHSKKDYRYFIPGAALTLLALIKPNRLTIGLAAAANWLGFYGAGLDARVSRKSSWDAEDIVGHASEESFPASDPPSWTQGPTVGS